MKLISPSRTFAAPNAVLVTLALAAALSASGCASISAPETSNTLAKFEQLNLQPDGTRTWRSATASKVGAARIDPQAITFASGVRLDEEQQQALRGALSEALARQFAEAGVRVVATQDASAITVRANITAVELANPALNVASTLLLFVPVSRGSMSVEMEALTTNDGQRDSQRVAAMAFSGTAGVNNIGSAFNGVGHAKLQADIAANKFVALVTGTPQK